MKSQLENQQRIVKFVQELLLDEENRLATPSLIAEKISLVLSLNPRWGDGLDHDAVTDELIRRFSLWIGEDTALKNDVGHEPWLSAERKHGWRYWQRYREWLETRLSWKAVDALDHSTDVVLGLVEDPIRTGTWDRRGLVVGHVQSGKTGNYTGLICKAADAGYKIIIVLAGLHNNLRSQTQMRLEEGFLGYETTPAVRGAGAAVGVAQIDSDAGIRPNCATNRSDSGDFSTRIARHLAVSPEQRPWLFVVKKNKTVLNELLKWVQKHVADAPRPNIGQAIHEDSNGLRNVTKTVTKLPLLVIDDEADHASVDTQELVVDEAGNPDDQHQPTTINKLIRRILLSFTRSVYVGYTATPFANIFIHERGETRGEGTDLFPASFIVNLATPSNYVGPTRMFGLQTSEGRRGGLPLFREVADHAGDLQGGWMPHKHKASHLPRYQGKDALPPSLIEAIDAFVLACAARRLRGQAQEHSSMLVHVTRFNAVQTEVYRQVEEHIRHMRQRITRGIAHEAILTRLRNLWERDFSTTTSAVRQVGATEGPDINESWDLIAAELPTATADIQVRMINGTAKDALDYADRQGQGLKVIAIGGDKLARGLTLEGLCVSYFLRASKMYDTLMQMGRWFGYRPGYLDLSRLYTTSELFGWFGHIADAAEELREEFDLMAATGSTPREYGLKVQSHPVLMVTSRLKMRAAKNLMLSFSGQLLETVAFYRDEKVLRQNLDAATKLIHVMGTPDQVDPARSIDGDTRKWAGFLWSDVLAPDVIDFLQSYRTHPAAYKVNSAMLAEFIQSMTNVNELTNWTVALLGVSEKKGKCHKFGADLEIYMNKRTGEKAILDRYSIGRLLDPKDEAIDLDDNQWRDALVATRAAYKPDPGRALATGLPDQPNGPAIRYVRGFGGSQSRPTPERGLLILYVLDPAKSDLGLPSDTPPVAAFGISFPGSNSGLKIEYKVNNVLWEQEYGAAD